MIRLVLRTIQHFWRQDLSLALGVAVGAAVIAGALLVGDSMRYSLDNIAALRLGQITHAVSAGDRYFTDTLAYRLEAALKAPCAPLLQLQGGASAAGGQLRAPKVQILGIDEHFWQAAGVPQNVDLAQKVAYLSQNLAGRLDLQAGDELLLRIGKLSVVPLNAPFVSEAGAITSATIKVGGILTDEEMGRFQLQSNQSAPSNVFLSLEHLNAIMGTQAKANYLLISAPGNLTDAAVRSALETVWTPADINLRIRHNPLQNAGEVVSDRVFIEPAVQTALENAPASPYPALTYFVNRLARGDRATPYSFVSSLPAEELETGGIVLNEWLADDLNAGVGDTVSLDYFAIGPLRELEERSAAFQVKRIVPMTGRWLDGRLMPDIPGLSDVGDCTDWETGVPVDLEKIREKDEDYWDDHRGAPKAYLSYPDARNLWENRFGRATLIRFPAPGLSPSEISTIIKNNIALADLGFQVTPVKSEASQAAREGVDFSQLFLGLSFFVVLAGLLLTTLLFSVNTEGRMEQIGTLSTLGFTGRQIRTILLLESGLIAVAGSAVGLALAVGYSQAVFSALNGIWSAIVRTQTLATVVYPGTLLAGFGASLFVSIAAIYVSLRRLLRQRAHALQTGTLRPASAWGRKLSAAVLYLSGAGAIFLIGWSYAEGEGRNAGLLFAAGGLLLICLLLFVQGRLRAGPGSRPSVMTAARLIRQNIVRRRRRSFLVVALFAIGAFIVVSTGMHRRDAFTAAQDRSSGTGGFLFYAESTVPVLRNLNDPAVRFEAGLEGQYPVVQLRALPGDDASCLNLNRVSAPSVWGVRPEALSGRFRFVARTGDLAAEQPWLSLQKRLGENLIPAVADQTVIQWGLGMQVGDTLQYVDEHGRTLGLKLIGGLANSIFQGAVLVDEQLLLEHFPSSSGSQIFLIDGDAAESELIREELQLSFRDYGWDMQPAAGRLAAFNSVENTYLSIFLILGGLGLLIGTIGLGVVLIRNLIDRRWELAALTALGFERNLVVRIVVLEHFYLLAIGVGIGIASSALASWPAWSNPNLDVSPRAVIVLTGLLFLTGVAWIALAAHSFVREKELVEALREECG